MSTVLADDTAARVRVRDDCGDLGAGRRAEHRKITRFFIGIAPPEPT